MDVTVEVLNKVREIVRTEGWSVAPTLIMSGDAAIRLTSGPRGTGHPRQHYLIVGDTVPNCFRALGEVLELLR